MLRKLFFTGKDFGDKMKRLNISSYAASAAFFVFLSLVPMLMVVCTVIPYTPLTEENLVEAVTDVTPDVVDELATSIISDVYVQSAGILSVAAVVMLWTAGKGVMALMRGLNVVNDVPEKRNYFVIRFVSTIYTFFLMLAMVMALFIMVFGNKMVNFILARFPRLQILFSFLMNFRFLVSWVVLMLLFCAIYAYLPDKKLQFKEQIPGACFASVGWSVFSWAFSMYVELSGSFTIYGSLALIIIVMMWIYCLMNILLLGAYFNNYFLPVNRALMDRKNREENQTSR